MKQIKAILFDLDNTLIDFIQMKKEACRAAVRAMIRSGLRMSEAKAYRELMKTYFKVGIESDRAFTKFLKSVNQFDYKILAAAINSYLKTKNNFLKPYPKVRSTLRKLKSRGVILAIVTDAPKRKAYQRLLAMKIDKYFDFVVGFEDTKHKKYSGLPLKVAIEKLKKELPEIKKNEIIMIGDSIKRDILPAKKLGMITVLAKYGQTEKERGKADYEISNISEILKL